MNWDSISAIAEMAGALAVIGSLVYVGFQLKQNTAAVRGERYHSISSDLINIYSQLADSERIPDLIYRFVDQRASLAEFDGGELVRIRLLFYIVLRLTEDVFRQVEDGNLPESALEYFGRNSWLTAPIAHELWPQLRANFPEDFAVHVESRYHYKVSVGNDGHET